MSRLIYVINGPGLNLLGACQPEGRGGELQNGETLADVERDCRALAQTLDLKVAFHQSNLEGGVIELIHDARVKAAGVIINAGAYAHTSISIHDALQVLKAPVIEVHLSNNHRREEFRHNSHVSRVASGVIAGCGTQGYQLGLLRMAYLLSDAGK